MNDSGKIAQELMVFDKIQRIDDSPKRNQESNFAFYNRSSWPEFGRVRNLIENFVSHYPKEEVEELIARIRSGNNVHFKSATFELFLHEALLKTNFELSPHPSLPNRCGSKPDFLVKDSNGQSFYLEAVLATESKEVNTGGETRKGVVLDYLSTNPHKNFLVEIEDEGYPVSQPSGKKLLKKIHNWLDSLDPDIIQQKQDSEGFDSISPFMWNHENWTIILKPIPLKSEKRGKSKNLIGAINMGGGWVDAWTPIRNAIKFKGSKYGTLEKPLLVAINLNSFYLSKIDEMQALFGQEQFIFQVGDSNKDPIMERAPNGAWHGRKGPQYTRVSGVWIFNDLQPSSVATRKHTIYHNPWAVHPLPESLKCFPHAISHNHKMNWNKGMSFAEIFQLDKGWPE